MGWLSRTFRPTAPTPAPAQTASPAGPPPVPEGQAGPPVPTMPTAGASSPTGRYGPLVSVTHFDVAPPELEWQLPLNGELYRLMPGSDRPDYSLFVLERPLHFYPSEGFDLGRVDAEQRVEDRKGRTMVRVHAMLLCSRFVGQQLHPGMKDLAVNLAYVIDNSLARDPEVDFAKIEFAATGFLSEGHAARPDGEAPSVAQPHGRTEEQTDEQSQERTEEQPQEQADEQEQLPTSSAALSDLLDEVARTLRQGVEEERGTRVERLSAVLTLDQTQRLTGLSGNADGQPPVPTAETFERLAELLARLSSLGEQGRLTAVTVRVDGDDVGHEVSRPTG